MGKVYLVTGVNRGIGLSLVKELLSQDPQNTVIGSVRDSSKVGDLFLVLSKEHRNFHIVDLDVADEKSISKLGAQLEGILGDDGSIDVFISNAGYYNPSKSPLEASRDEMIQHFLINTLGPFEVFKVVLPFMRRSSTRKAFFISSDASSIGKVFSSASSYGVSKAALNRTMRGVAVDLAPEGFVIGLIHPGWVETDMLAFAIDELSDETKERMKTNFITPDVSASQMLGVIESSTQESTQTLINNLGEFMPW